MRIQTSALSCGIAVFAVLTSSFAFAEDSVAPGFTLSRYEPAERGSRYFTLESLDWNATSPTLGVVIDYAYKPLVVYRVTADDKQEIVAVARHFAVGHVGGTFNLGPRIRLGVDLPVVMYAEGTTEQVGLVTYNAPHRSGLGDLRLGGDWRFYGAATHSVRAGLGVRLYLPTGDPLAYGGDSTVRATLQLNAAGQIATHIAWAARVGAHVKGREATYAGAQLGSELQAGVAAGFRTSDGRLLIGPEVAASTTLSHAFAAQSTSVDVMLGAHYDVTPNWRLGAGLGRGATVALGSPSMRGLLTLDWIPFNTAGLEAQP